jgi:hypothetical protein
MSMLLADSAPTDVGVMIRRQGFRKWYEGQLRRSHVHLVLLLFCAVGFMAGLEAFGQQVTVGGKFLVALCAAASAGIGLWALRRYLHLLLHAEFVADQAVCRGCEAYAQWDVEPRGDAATQRLCVCCRRCRHQWDIELM